MTELEILKHRIEILEKGFQEIIALIKKDRDCFWGASECVQAPNVACGGCGCVNNGEDE